MKAVNLHRLVIESAARHPDRVAVAGPDGVLTYRELDAAANALAHRLAAAGVRRGDRVVIWAPKSAGVVVAMQATLRLGAAYVPVDGGTPPARAAAIARDCAARSVCVAPEDRHRIGEVARTGVRVVDLPTAPAAVTVASAGGAVSGGAAPVDTAVGPDDLAYILYTSGSTGEPKGVCLSHRNALAFVGWAAAELGAAPDDRFANHAALTFDLSVLDLYVPFATGGSVHLVPAELAYAPVQLVEFLHQRRITVWYSVPSALILMIRDGGLLAAPPPESLRAVLFAGEPFPIRYVRQLAGWTRARLLNLYGPTETNVCTYHEVAPADLARDRPVPIGRASCGDTVWAVGPGGAPVAPGGEGELLVAGPTVMLGYWGREAHAGPYRTGDVVRVLPGGGFDFVGRRDHLVKVRGNRVELGGVETVLIGHPDVDEAVAVVSGAAMNARLEAFVLPRPDRAPGVLALRRHCADRLPRHMVPDGIHLLSELPRTRNGKVDRAALLRLAVPAESA